MPTYRRLFVPGGTWFFTVALARRGSALLVERVDVLRRTFADAQADHRFRLGALVVLPDHLHCVMTLAEDDRNFPLIWDEVKGRFAGRVEDGAPCGQSGIAADARGIWQRRSWQHPIRDEADFRAHVEYCWSNPVKHGLVARVRDWPHSTFHRDVALGIVPAEFGGQVPRGVFGEPVWVR